MPCPHAFAFLPGHLQPLIPGSAERCRCARERDWVGSSMLPMNTAVAVSIISAVAKVSRPATGPMVPVVPPAQAPAGRAASKMGAGTLCAANGSPGSIVEQDALSPFAAGYRLKAGDHRGGTRFLLSAAPARPRALLGSYCPNTAATSTLVLRAAVPACAAPGRPPAWARCRPSLPPAVVTNSCCWHHCRSRPSCRGPL